MNIKAVINAFLVFLFISVAISAIKAHKEFVGLRRWQNNASKRLAANKKKLLKIKNKLELTKSKKYLLKLAREKLYMKKADETVILIKGLPKHTAGK